MALDAHGLDDDLNRELKAWIKGLAKASSAGRRKGRPEFSREDADYLRRIATDGTLKAALQEIAASEPDLAG